MLFISLVYILETLIFIVGRVNHINSPNPTKNTTSAKDHTASNIKLKGGDNLSSASSDSSTDRYGTHLNI